MLSWGSGEARRRGVLSSEDERPLPLGPEPHWRGQPAFPQGVPGSFLLLSPLSLPPRPGRELPFGDTL